MRQKNDLIFMDNANLDSLKLMRNFSGKNEYSSDFKFLLQGKLIKVWLEDKRYLKLKLYLPKNVTQYAIGDEPLFDEITLVIELRKLIIGTLNNDTLLITLEDNDKVFEVFDGRCFLSDFGHPKYHGADDIDIPTLIDAKFSETHLNTPSKDLELIIPAEDDLPYIRVVFSHFSIFDKNGESISYNGIIEDLRIYYEDHFIRSHDRMMCDWEYLFGIKNSLAFYGNQLKQHHWFKHQFNLTYGEPKIDREIGDLTLPCWIEIEDISIKWDNYDNLVDLKMIGATKCHLDFKKGSTYLWLPSEDNIATLTLISNELINCDKANPFEYVLDLYFSKWLPCDSMSATLIHDLKRIVNSDSILSDHPRKHKFYLAIDNIINERNLTLV